MIDCFLQHVLDEIQLLNDILILFQPTFIFYSLISFEINSLWFFMKIYFSSQLFEQLHTWIRIRLAINKKFVTRIVKKHYICPTFTIKRVAHSLLCVITRTRLIWRRMMRSFWWFPVTSSFSFLFTSTAWTWTRAPFAPFFPSWKIKFSSSLYLPEYTCSLRSSTSKFIMMPSIKW